MAHIVFDENDPKAKPILNRLNGLQTTLRVLDNCHVPVNIVPGVHAVLQFLQDELKQTQDEFEKFKKETADAAKAPSGIQFVQAGKDIKLDETF